jgi:hypothetical protein
MPESLYARIPFGFSLKKYNENNGTSFYQGVETKLLVSAIIRGETALWLSVIPLQR